MVSTLYMSVLLQGLIGDWFSILSPKTRDAFLVYPLVFLFYLNYLSCIESPSHVLEKSMGPPSLCCAIWLGYHLVLVHFFFHVFFFPLPNSLFAFLLFYFMCFYNKHIRTFSVKKWAKVDRTKMRIIKPRSPRINSFLRFIASEYMCLEK